MSALPPKADMFSVESYVCYVPQADVRPRAGAASPRVPSGFPVKMGWDGNIHTRGVATAGRVAV